MAIQLRRGVYNNFDPSKLLPGEVAVVQSGDPNTRNGKAVYIATLSGEIKRFAFVEDVEEIVYNVADDIVAQQLADLEERVEALESGGGGSGLTSEVKDALLACFDNVAWKDTNGQTYYDALEEALYPTVTTRTVSYSLSHVTSSNNASTVTSGASYTATLTASSGYTINTVTVTMGGADVTSTVYSSGTITIPSVTGNIVITATAVASVSSISAVYTQSGTVYPDTNLDSLKSDLVVTATYTGGTTSTIPGTDYILSGTLEAGTSTITVTYGGETTTFDVVVVDTISMELGGLNSDGSESDSTTRLRTVNMIPIDLSVQEIVDTVAFDVFAVSSATGALTVNAARLASQRIPVTGGQEFTATVADGYYLKAFVYDSDGEIKSTGIGDFTSKSISGTIPSDCAFVRLVVKHSDGSDMANSDITSLSLTVNGNNYNTVQGSVADLYISSTASVNGSAGKFFLRGYDSNGLHVTNHNNLEDTLLQTNGTVKGFSGVLLSIAQIRVGYRTNDGTDNISSFSGTITINGVERRLSYQE